jgi:hypothetical protein
MFLGSLTLSSILITFGFQTASAIVMAVAGDALPIKFYSCARGKLTWAKRDVSTRLDCENVRAQPGLRTLGIIGANRALKKYFPTCELLSSTGGVFHFDNRNIIRIGSPAGGSQDRATTELTEWSWDVMTDLQAHHLLKEDLNLSGGRVYFLPTDGKIETLDTIAEDINEDNDMVDPQTEELSYEIQAVPDQMPQISDRNTRWVPIRHTVIDNVLVGPGSTPVEAIVDGKEAVFYSGPEGELKLLLKDAVVRNPHMNRFENLN